MPDSFLRPWPLDSIAWGTTLCEAPDCFRPAELAGEVEGLEGIPLCIGCADELLERTVAIAEGGTLWTLGELGAERVPLAQELPPLFEQTPRRRPPSRIAEWELDGRTPELWLSEQGHPGRDVDEDIPF